MRFTFCTYWHFFQVLYLFWRVLVCKPRLCGLHRCMHDMLLEANNRVESKSSCKIRRNKTKRCRTMFALVVAFSCSSAEQGTKLHSRLGGKCLGNLRREHHGDAYSMLRSLQHQAALLMKHATRKSNDVVLYDHLGLLTPWGFGYAKDVPCNQEQSLLARIRQAHRIDMEWDEADEYARWKLGEYNKLSKYTWQVKTWTSTKTTVTSTVTKKATRDGPFKNSMSLTSICTFGNFPKHETMLSVNTSGINNIMPMELACLGVHNLSCIAVWSSERCKLDLQVIKTLQVTKCTLGKVWPSNPTDLSNVTCLKLIGTYSFDFSSLENLRSLTLTATAYDCLKLPRGLAKLKLESTRCDVDLLVQAAAGTKLESLTIKRNTFDQTTIPTQLGKLTSLKRLVLINNSFIGSLPREIALLPNLRCLQIREPTKIEVDQEVCNIITSSYINVQLFG